MLLSFYCYFVMVDALWSNFNDLSLLHPIKCSRSLNRDIALVDRSEEEEVGFDISVRDRTTYPLKLFESFGYVLYLPLRWKALGHVVLLLRGTIKRNYGDVIAAQKGRKLILTLQGFHVIQHKRSVNLHLTIKTSQELRMLSRSLSDCKSLLLNVMIQVLQFIRNGQLCH